MYSGGIARPGQHRKTAERAPGAILGIVHDSTCAYRLMLYTIDHFCSLSLMLASYRPLNFVPVSSDSKFRIFHETNHCL